MDCFSLAIGRLTKSGLAKTLRAVLDASSSRLHELSLQQIKHSKKSKAVHYVQWDVDDLIDAAILATTMLGHYTPRMIWDVDDLTDAVISYTPFTISFDAVMCVLRYGTCICRLYVIFHVDCSSGAAQVSPTLASWLVVCVFGGRTLYRGVRCRSLLLLQ